MLNVLAARGNEHIGVLSNGSVRSIPDMNHPFFEDISLLSAVGGQQQQITGVCTSAEGLIWSCTNRGQLSAWDLRASKTQAAQQCLTSTQNMSCMDVGYAGSLLACGTEEAIDSKIVFWDARKLQSSAPLGQYVESHSDSITAVRFQGQMFFSGSVDGLVCGFDVTQPSESASLVSVVNPNGACLKLGCFGTRGLYVTTSSETFHLFDYDTAQTISSYDNDVMRGVGCRELLTEKTAGKMELTYLIDGLWEPKTQKLLMLAGNGNGEAFGFEVTLNGFEPLGPLVGVHSEVVRCCKSYDGGKASGFNIITGGEDGKVCLWKPE